MIYYIIGYPCCGKTTFSKEISKKFGIAFVDIDEEIVKRENKQISEIFDTKGEIAFRKIETKTLHDITKNSSDDVVVSCGGGLPCYNGNMEYMLKHGIVIYIKTPIDTIMARMTKPGEIEKRPLFYKNFQLGTLKEFIEEQYTERDISFYNKANITINYEKDFYNKWSKLEFCRNS
jgi:shikimate kinase